MRAMPRFALLLLLLPRLSSQPADDRIAIEAAVLEVNNQMTRAAQDGDADRLFSYILDTDKGSIIQNGALLLTRAQAWKQTKDSFLRIRRIEYRWKQRYVTVVSPTVAMLAAEGESTAITTQGQSLVTSFAQTQVFVLTDGKWKVLHAHHSSVLR
jgi:hypothetical protein